MVNDLYCDSFKVYEGKEPYLFICYARKDSERVFRVVNDLNGFGCRIWYDRKGIPPGDNWEKAIGTHIRNCGQMIAFLTNSASGSEYVQKEISYANKKHKKILGIFLEPTQLEPGLDWIFSNLQVLSHFDSDAVDFKTTLLSGIEKACFYKGIIQGKIRLLDTELCADVGVELKDDSDIGVTTYQTDREGRFLFTKVRPGRYTLRCRKPGYLDRSMDCGELEADGKFQLPPIELTPETKKKSESQIKPEFMLPTEQEAKPEGFGSPNKGSAHRIPPRPVKGRMDYNGFSLLNATIVTPHSVNRQGGLTVTSQGRIGPFSRNAGKSVDLRGASHVFPALINAHDHFYYNYLPRVGPVEGKFYLNWSEWDRDYDSSYVSEESAKIGIENRYLLSSYKNLFSGVVTVNDHFPHHMNEPMIPMQPIRILRDYALAHECSSFDLKWGDGIEVEYAKATKHDIPFITHLEEGYDEETQRGLDILEEMGCLDGHDVLIHCIGFSDEDIRKAARGGATLVWCPASNLFLYNKTCKIRQMLQSGANVAIGTDSTATGSINLLEEMRFARATYRRLYGEDLPARRIVEMVTVNPAKAFRMDKKIGSLGTGMLADFLVLKAKSEDPYEDLVRATMEDIQLLAMEGVPIYGEESFGEFFSPHSYSSSRIQVGRKPMLVKGDPAGMLEMIRRLIGFRKIFDFLPFG